MNKTFMGPTAAERYHGLSLGRGHGQEACAHYQNLYPHPDSPERKVTTRYYTLLPRRAPVVLGRRLRHCFSKENMGLGSDLDEVPQV
jgi:hypothetical protein